MMCPLYLSVSMENVLVASLMLSTAQKGLRPGGRDLLGEAIKKIFKKSFFLDVFPEVIIVTLRVAVVLLSGIHHTRVGGVLGGVLLLAEYDVNNNNKAKVANKPHLSLIKIS